MAWGEVFALSSALAWALAVVLFRRSGETLPAFELNLFKNCLGFALMIPTVFLFDGLNPPSYTYTELGVVITSGLIGIALADTLYFRALNLMGASRMGIVASLFSPFVILLSTVFLGERFGSWQWLGFLMVMGGVVLVTWYGHRSTINAENVRKGVIIAVISVFMMAVGIVMVKEILANRPFLWTVGLRLTGGIVGMIIYMLVRGQWQRVIQNFRQPQPWGTVVFASFLGAYLAVILWMAGYRLIDASVASVLNSTNTAFIVILAWWILNEQINRRKLIGISLTLGGVMVMLGF